MQPRYVMRLWNPTPSHLSNLKGHISSHESLLSNKSYDCWGKDSDKYLVVPDKSTNREWIAFRKTYLLYTTYSLRDKTLIGQVYMFRFSQV